MTQRVYGGARLLGDLGPCPRNIQLLDSNSMPMVSLMQATGLQVDLSHFAKMEIELTRDMEQITEDVKAMTGHYINIDSGDQVADLLFKRLGLKQARVKMTASGDRESVEDEVLKAIQHDHPVVGKIQNYKEFSKLLGTYVVPMPKLARRVAFGIWRMFPNFTTTRIPSSRYACKDPNLLAMPTRTDRGQDIRKGFITDPGWSFFSVDYSQIEVRMAAHLSQDENLLAVYFNEEDVYSDFAISAFKLKDERYKNEQGVWIYPHVHKMNHRYPAKTCILASIYAVTASGLLDQMPIICGNCNLEAAKHNCYKFIPLWTENKCQDLINAFYMKYAGVMRDRIRNHQIMRKMALIYSMWGRWMHTAAVRSVHSWIAEAALREGANFPYQEGANGVLKVSLAHLYDDLEQMNMMDVVHPLLPVHDEIVGEARNDVIEEWANHVKYRFETDVKISLPIKAGADWGAESWGHIKK